MTDTAEHWNKVYKKTEIEKTGWYEQNPEPSLRLVNKCGFAPDAKILDVGSGASTLIHRLIELGFRNLSVNDISGRALEKAKANLNDEFARAINWIPGDICDSKTARRLPKIDLWHDRTVLHFLTEEVQQIGYLNTLKQVVNPGGFVIIAVFALGGAQKCSGLDVKNYSAEMISEFLGGEFELLESFDHLYIQPSGGERPFIYTLSTRTM